MRKFALFTVAATFACGVQASWYWPFGSDGVDTSAPRISELMEPASELIDEASDLASDGKIDESVEKYRKALDELDRIERENPERAKSAEFATLRNKRAYVNAAIDSMLLEQVKRNAKVVAVSDTTELERKLAEERWTGHMGKVSSALMRKDMVTAKAGLGEAFGCYTNAFARASVHNVGAAVGFLSGDFDEVHEELAKSKSCIRGYRAGDPFIDRAIDNSLSRIRGLLTDYGEIIETAKVVKVEGNVVSNYLSHLEYMRSRLSPYDFDQVKEAGKLHAAVTNLWIGATNVPPRAAEAFASALADFKDLSPKVAGVRKALAYAEFPVLKVRVSNLIDKANKMPKPKNEGPKSKDGDEKSDKIKRLIKGAETLMNRLERVCPEFAGNPDFVALQNAWAKTKAELEKQLASKGAGDNQGAALQSGPKEDARKAGTLSKSAGPYGSRSFAKPLAKPFSKPLTKREQAIADIMAGDYAAAELVISEMLAAKPNNAMALNLKAAMEMRQGKLDEAEKTLDLAISTNPRSPSAYYNFALLELQKGAGNKSSAKRYYETSRTMGGAADPQMEAMLK